MTDQTKKSDAAPKNVTGKMPTTFDVVRETVASFATDKTKSKVIGIDRATLHEIGVMLVDASTQTQDALDYLNDQYEEEVCSRSGFYLFASEFKTRFGAIQQRYRQRLAKLTVTDITGNQVTDMAAVITHQLTNLMAERIVDATALEDLANRDISFMLSLVDALTKNKHKEQELQFKADAAARSAEKLASDLEKSKLDQEKLRQQIEDAKKKFEEEIKARQAKSKTGVITEEDLNAVRESIFGR